MYIEGRVFPLTPPTPGMRLNLNLNLNLKPKSQSQSQSQPRLKSQSQTQTPFPAAHRLPAYCCFPTQSQSHSARTSTQTLVATPSQSQPPFSAANHHLTLPNPTRRARAQHPGLRLKISNSTQSTPQPHPAPCLGPILEFLWPTPRLHPPSSPQPGRRLRP